MPVQIRAVAFDIDGTLYPSRPMYLRSALHAFPHLRFLRAFARVRRAIRDVYPIDDFLQLQNVLLADEMHITPDRASRLIRHWHDIDLDAVYRRLSPFTYVREFIQSLRDSGVKTAVLSDFPISNKLTYLGLDGLWDCMYSSEDSGYLKPRGEPFQTVIDCLDESPEHIVYIGNNYEYDIVGAKNVGLMTAYLSSKTVAKRDNISDKPTFEFGNYRQLAAKVFEFVG